MGWYIATIAVVICAFCYIPLAWIAGRWIRYHQQKLAERKKLVCLTFDDGPGSRLTSQILDILRKNKIRASFFLLGRNIAGRETIVQRIQQEGHSIASHSYGHLHAWKRWPGRLVADICQGWRAIDQCLDSSNLKYPFRPPYGKINLAILLYLVFRRVPIIYWSVDSGDTGPAEYRSLDHAAELLGKSGGGIVLFHDFDRSSDETDSYVLQSLESVIRTAKQMNLRFSTVDELTTTTGTPKPTVSG